METKLFSIILCLLVLEATGSSLKNLTSIQHRTEDASARSSLRASTPFDFFNYGKEHYDTIYRHIPQVETKSQFAFLMIVRSKAERWGVPQHVATFLNGDETFQSLKTAQVYPSDKQSNLVIAGVTFVGKPRGTKDLPYHAENKLIDAMPTMDAFYDQTYGYICPWLIILGSNFDTCCGKKKFQGKQHDKTLEIVYRRATGKLTPEL